MKTKLPKIPIGEKFSLINDNFKIYEEMMYSYSHGLYDLSSKIDIKKAVNIMLAAFVLLLKP